MKKLILMAGMTGLLVTGAFAQSQNATAQVTVYVQPYMTVTSITGQNWTFNVTDGGFNGGAYASGSKGAFNVIANCTYNLNTTLTPNQSSWPYNLKDIFWWNVTSTSWNDTGWVPFDSNGNGTSLGGQPSTSSTGTPYQVDVQLLGNPSSGLPVNTSGLSATFTVTVSAAT